MNKIESYTGKEISLRTRFILAVIIICVVCLSIVSCISYFISYNLVKKEASQKAEQVVIKNAGVLNSWVSLQGQNLHSIVEDLEIEGQFNDDYVNKYLIEKYKMCTNGVIDYYVGFVDKKELSASCWVPPTNYDCTKRIWYMTAVNQDRLVYTTPYLDANTRQMVITISEPIKIDGKLIGVAAADIKLDDVMKLAQTIKMDEICYPLLLDNEYNFMIHPNKEFRPTAKRAVNAGKVLNGIYRPLMDRINSGQYGVIKLKDYDGVNRYFALSRIESTNWTFGIAIPSTEYARPLRKLLAGFGWAVALSLLLGLMIIWPITSRLLKPVQQLNNTVRRFARKDFDARVPVVYRDEIGELSQNFNDMADIIQEYNSNLEHLVVERTRELQEKNQNIMESIDYSKRILESIIPDLNNYQGFAYKDHFVIWKPRDIVGGDFYWCRQKEDVVFLALADCTGHGVPGALMTMTVNAILNRIIEEAEIQTPAVILGKLNQILKETLRQDAPDALTNDGVDVGLCMIRPNQGDLIYAGSKISLFAYQGDEIIRVKGDRQSLGYKRSLLNYQYTDHQVTLDKQVFYLTTDGMLDQNGAENNKAFGITRFKQTLLSMKDLPLDQQKDFLLDLLNTYMGCETQRDDITIMGFKI